MEAQQFDILKFICDEFSASDQVALCDPPNLAQVGFSLPVGTPSNGIAMSSPGLDPSSSVSGVPTQMLFYPQQSVPEMGSGRSVGPESSSEDLEEIFNKSTAVKCPICHDLAGKHFYYGVQACISCRGFFQRSVRNKFYVKFSCCKGSQRCRITARSRKNCKWCRFQKCLQAGMKTCYVLSNDGGAATRAKAVIPIRTMTKNASLSQIFTELEVDQALSIYKNLLSFGYRSYYQLFSKNQKEFLSFIQVMNNEGVDNTSISQSFTESNKQATINYFFSIDDMVNLSPFDRMTLINKNYPGIFGLLWSVYSYHPDLCTFYEEFLKHGYENRSVDPEIDKILGLIELKQLMGQKPKNLSIAITFQKHPATTDLIQKHDNLVSEVNGGLREAGQNRADYVIVLLLAHIFMFSTDFGESLQNRERIQAIQEKYLVLLHRYLISHYKGRARSKLSEILMLSLGTLAGKGASIEEEKLNLFPPVFHRSISLDSVGCQRLESSFTIKLFLGGGGWALGGRPGGRLGPPPWRLVMSTLA
eukprot:snap_masked-scaffold394_size185225-processed-gene-0.7 protein:Tk12263 transcript:snap_masked-scaffold394_size185225-processed-gene-0.7-mRNA-1 annotation:"steroid hormone receptor err2"